MSAGLLKYVSKVAKKPYKRGSLYSKQSSKPMVLSRTFNDAVTPYNKDIISLGRDAKYINPINIRYNNNNYTVRAASRVNNKGGSNSPYPTHENTVVEIVNNSTGKKVYQPFYKSSGQSRPESRTEGSWLPFEGKLEPKMKVPIKNVPTGSISAIDESLPYAENYIVGYPYGALPYKKESGWLIKAYKDLDTGKLVNSSTTRSVFDSKRGLDLHKEIDVYLRSIWV